MRPHGCCASDAAREFALRTLTRLLAEAWDGGEVLHHVIAYPEGVAPAERVPGTLDDYAFTVHACIDAWLASGEMSFYAAAVKLADAMIARFYDRTAGALLRLRRASERRCAAGRIGRAPQAAAGFAHARRQSHRCRRTAAP